MHKQIAHDSLKKSSVWRQPDLTYQLNGSLLNQGAISIFGRRIAYVKEGLNSRVRRPEYRRRWANKCCILTITVAAIHPLSLVECDRSIDLRILKVAVGAHYGGRQFDRPDLNSHGNRRSQVGRR